MQRRQATTNTSCPVATDDHNEPSDRKFCDSFECSDGYIPIDKADDVKCWRGRCKESQCCDKVCSSFDCPDYYEPVDHADTTVCKDSKCSKDQCCEPGEKNPEITLDALDVDIVLFGLILRHRHATTLGTSRVCSYVTSACFSCPWYFKHHA